MERLSLRFILACASFVFLCSGANAQAAGPAAVSMTKPLLSDVASFVYFTGVGCPHCAVVDPILLRDKVRKGNVLIVEYEIYRDSLNAPLLMAYDSQFSVGLGVPMLIVDDKKGGAIAGDTPILEALDSQIAKRKGGGIVLPAGARPFLSLPLTDLPRLPKLWFRNRVAVRKDVASKESDSIKAFLLNGTEPQGCALSSEKHVALSGTSVQFAKACSFKGWILMQD